VYGGAPAWEQKNALKSLNGEISSGSLVGFVVVATPGRLCDLMAQNAVTLNACFVVTLDEADRMLDMGFEPQLREVFAAVPAAPAEHEKVGAGRQTTLFTATWPKSVRKLAGAFLAEGASRGDSGDARDDANDEDASDKKRTRRDARFSRRRRRRGRRRAQCEQSRDAAFHQGPG
jgi:superfamily II DNA/RNA helicase